MSSTNPGETLLVHTRAELDGPPARAASATWPS